MSWTSLTYAFGSLLTSSKMTQLFDNFTALATGLSGAPEITIAAMKIAENIVVNAGSAANIALSTIYGFWPSISPGGANLKQLQLAKDIAGVGYQTVVYIDPNGQSVSVRFQYISASPPYKIGNKTWGEFVFLLRKISTGEVICLSTAPDPCWSASKSHLHKNHKDRIVARPHPFVDYWDKDPAVDGLEVVLLDVPKAKTDIWLLDMKVKEISPIDNLTLILKGKGLERAHSDFGLSHIPRFSDQVKIIT